MPKLEIHYADDYAALYFDGVLDREGKVHNVEERAFFLLGVKQVVDDAFLGGNEKAYITLAEVHQYHAERENNKVLAAELRKQAEDLLNKARVLEGM